jgi:hypothetical protein
MLLKPQCMQRTFKLSHLGPGVVSEVGFYTEEYYKVTKSVRTGPRGPTAKPKSTFKLLRLSVPPFPRE